MVPQAIQQVITLDDGRTITIETGKLAKQADGSVIVRSGDTMLMATVVSAKEAREGVDFLPLTVEYKEKFSAAGRFPGGFIKREGRPTDEEILVARLVDRILRPIFPEDYHAETQVIVQLISIDKNVRPDSLAGLAASAAISVSDIPFDGPISEVRVARINGKFVINPSTELLKQADIDLMVGASMDSVAMVEGEMSEVSEAEMLEAIKVAHEAIRVQIQAQLDLAAQVEKANPKREYCHETHDASLKEAVYAATYDKAFAVATEASAKHERSEKFDAIFEEFAATIPEEEQEEKLELAKVYFGKVKKEAVRNMILDLGQRLDGRTTTEIRPIWSEIDYLPSAHGSAVFTRGETQSLSTVTLGTKLDVNVVDGVSEKYEEKFYLHYNFPPFSTGEARMLRGVSRREIGHGNLAYRALKPMIPADFPYTVRVVSDILESNGSSSMATVCAGTLALMDAGVAMTKPVSGIAMGLITNQESGKWAVLSDILGDEDHLGDMDFKVTGTEDGITACQMDIKIKGLSYEILQQALEQARDGRLHILNKITETISEPRTEVKEHAPRIVQFDIPKEFIGAVIGPGGKVIQKIQEETETTIVLTEEGPVGKIEILGTGSENIARAEEMIRAIVFMPEIGEEYDVEVKSLMAFGAIVELAPGKDSLLHVSELDWKRVENVEDVLKEGDKLRVKLIDIDRSNGRLKVSRKALLPKPEGYVERPPRERRDNRNGDRRGPRRDNRGGDRRGGDRRERRDRD